MTVEGFSEAGGLGEWVGVEPSCGNRTVQTGHATLQ